MEKYILSISTDEDPLLHELYRKTYISVVNPNMVSGHIQGRLLYHLVDMLKAKKILEIGTYTGYSAISMARALPDDGQLHTIEINDELEDISSEYIGRSGLKDKIITYQGDAKEIIPGIDTTFDLVFIDGDKREYMLYYNAVFDKLRPGGYILADNVLWDGKAYNPEKNDAMTCGIKEFNKTISKDDRVEKLILPIRDGLLIIRKK